MNSFGPDSVDLAMLGLNARQELSPKFSANGLEYQVVANYAGTGTDTMRRPDYAEGHPVHSYFALTTIWGPMGAGWSVHMGKLLSTGATYRTSYFFGPYFMKQCGFPEDGCTCLFDGADSQNSIRVRRLFNTVVEPSGVRHPMYNEELTCYLEGNGVDDLNNDVCKWLPDFSTDYSWIKADLQDDWACHATKGWWTQDGTYYEVRRDGLVNSITDLSGNWVNIEYFDEEGEFPPCTGAACASYRDYRVSMSKFKDLSRDITHEFPVLMDPGWPLKEIRDSQGRVITFTLTQLPIAGKYRIQTISSESPASGGRRAVYKLHYQERDIYNWVESTEIPGNRVRDACGSSTYLSAACFAPELRSDPEGHWMRGAFLTQVENPDGSTVEYDYYSWGDLKSIRLVNGGIIEYEWRYLAAPDSGLAGHGVKLVKRTVRPDATSSEKYVELSRLRRG